MTCLCDILVPGRIGKASWHRVDFPAEEGAWAPERRSFASTHLINKGTQMLFFGGQVRRTIAFVVVVGEGTLKLKVRWHGRSIETGSRFPWTATQRGGSSTTTRSFST